MIFPYFPLKNVAHQADAGEGVLPGHHLALRYQHLATVWVTRPWRWDLCTKRRGRRNQKHMGIYGKLWKYLRNLLKSMKHMEKSGKYLGICGNRICYRLVI
jgi:hypothetical protein